MLEIIKSIDIPLKLNFVKGTCKLIVRISSFVHNKATTYCVSMWRAKKIVSKKSPIDSIIKIDTIYFQMNPQYEKQFDKKKISIFTSIIT